MSYRALTLFLPALPWRVGNPAAEFEPAESGYDIIRKRGTHFSSQFYRLIRGFFQLFIITVLTLPTQQSLVIKNSAVAGTSLLSSVTIVGKTAREL